MGHLIIINEGFVEEIAEAIWEMNNQMLTPDHYLAIAWSGLEDFVGNHSIYNDSYFENIRQLGRELEGNEDQITIFENCK